MSDDYAGPGVPTFGPPLCAIEVGHAGGAIATWMSGDLFVCDRHRSQYDERDDLGPFDWQSLGGGR